MVTSLESQVAVIDRVVQMVIMIMVVVTQMIKREMQNSHIGLYHGHFYCYHHNNEQRPPCCWCHNCCCSCAKCHSLIIFIKIVILMIARRLKQTQVQESSP